MDHNGRIPFENQPGHFFDEQMHAGGVGPVPPYLNPYAEMPRKSKLAAGVLAFFIPGTGHFYLGLMPRGLFVMMMFILDITALSYLVNKHSADDIFVYQVLLGCLIPVIYFFNLFDALQSTDQVNTYRRAIQAGILPPAPAGSDSLGRQVKGGTMGMALIAVGLFLFLVSKKPAWLDDLFQMMGSYVGAVILIGLGLLLFLNESKKR